MSCPAGRGANAQFGLGLGRPGHNRLALGELTPRLSLKILEEAKDQIAEAEALLKL